MKILKKLVKDIENLFAENNLALYNTFLHIKEKEQLFPNSQFYTFKQHLSGPLNLLTILKTARLIKRFHKIKNIFISINGYTKKYDYLVQQHIAEELMHYIKYNFSYNKYIRFEIIILGDIKDKELELTIELGMQYEEAF